MFIAYFITIFILFISLALSASSLPGFVLYILASGSYVVIMLRLFRRIRTTYPHTTFACISAPLVLIVLFYLFYHAEIGFWGAFLVSTVETFAITYLLVEKEML